MALDGEQKQELKTLLVAIYGGSFAHIQPTEETLELTEAMLAEVNKCNKRIQTLFQSLRCAMIGKGWLRRCLKCTSFDLI